MRLEAILVSTTFAAALASALVAGTFLAFSSFIMSGLARLPPAQGIAAMQAVNVTVLGSLFLVTFLALVPVALGLGVSAFAVPAAVEARPWLLSAGVIYTLGAFAVTMAFNVPRNDALAALDPGSAEAAARWADYLSSWTAWNHVRTGASALAAVLYAVSLLRLTGK
jgi:uncharacterized membrane protein